MGNPVDITLPITGVTLYEDRAEVMRTGTVTLPDGASLLRVRGVSAVVSDAHVAAAFKGAATTVDDIRVVRRLEGGQGDPGQHAATRALLDAATERQRTARAARARTQERHQALVHLVAVSTEQATRALWANPREGTRLLGGLDALRAEVEKAALLDLEAVRAEKAALEEVNRLQATLGRASGGPTRAVADLHLRVHSAGGTAEVTLNTLVPCAQWRPAHEVDLRADGTLRWERHATAWQATGEDWANVPLTFSTARPSAGALLPPLSEDILRSRQKTAEERKVIRVQHRQEAIPSRDLQGAAPGVFDGGQPRRFTSAAPVTIPSDGRPHRVTLGSFDAPVTTSQVAMPELSAHVFLRASLKNLSDLPILAGPVVLKRQGHLVGTGDVPYVGPGEAFDLSLGSLDALRVRYQRRRVEQERTLGRDVTHYVQEAVLTAGGAGPENVLVFMRMPVSELAQLKVLPSLAHCSEGTLDPDTQGLVRMPVQVEPGKERKVSLGFHLDAGADVKVPAPW